ncbi:hypothetical protein RMT89_19055 [Streptomyces sp. P17]|nr:hypothetical protein [Streptomyces sp. P17]
MRQRSLAGRTSVARAIPEGRSDSQNRTGPLSPAGRLAGSHRAGRMKVLLSHVTLAVVSGVAFAYADSLTQLCLGNSPHSHAALRGAFILSRTDAPANANVVPPTTG